MKIRLFQFFKNNFIGQLIFIAIGLIFLISSAMNMYFYFQEKDELTNNLIYHSRILAKLLASNSRLGVFTGDSMELANQAQMLFSEPNCIKIIIYDDEGIALLELENNSIEKTNQKTNSLTVDEIYKSITQPNTLEPYYRKEDTIVLTEPIMVQPAFVEDGLYLDETELLPVNLKPTAKRSIGQVALVMSTQELDKQVMAFRYESIAVSMTIALISSFLIYLIINSLTTPLVKLSNEISRHQEGQDLPDKQVNTSKTNFNKMIVTIRESYNTINSLKTNLEKTVDERTKELSKSNHELAQQTIVLGNANQQLATTLEELQNTQSQLIQAEKIAALGQVIGGLSHEINNSVNFISSSLPLLEKNISTYNKALNISPESKNLPYKTSPDAQGAAINTQLLMDNIREGVRRITGVINDLRHFSYNKGDKFELTDIHIGITSSISILRHEYQNRIEFIEELSKELPLIDGIGGQLNQVFMNVLLNAVHAISDKGQIICTTKLQGEHAHIVIKDNGCGISEENLSSIFTPFYSTRDIGSGSGMGLSISYSIVKKHNGEIIVNSSSGQGTTFEVILPLRHTENSGENKS